MTSRGVRRREWLMGAAAAMLAPRFAIAQQPAPTTRAMIIAQSYRDNRRLFLPNTVRDGQLLAQTFQRLGFGQVNLLQDQDAAHTIEALGGFLGQIASDDIVVVYLAGHGVEIASENLLMLNGAQEFISLQGLMEVLQERSRTVLVFLDACRQNPYDEVISSGRISRAVAAADMTAARAVSIETVGFDQVRSAGATGAGRLQPFTLQGSGIKIVFSTDPYNVALDGATAQSSNSPFAQALSRRLTERRSLDDVIALTTGDVLAATDNSQSPWAQGSIGRPLFLAGPPLQRNPARPRFQVPG